ncbi:cysteine protease atg4da [Patella vulgata]|uniref:cysteine protease atg4da n=1 Tax=Patella vulgata TaxID=6465 RepID=UPI00217FF78E|nr:cysteine protease atg4da [Patella vulgata]
MEGIRQRLSSTSNPSTSDDVTSLDSWTDALINSDTYDLRENTDYGQSSRGAGSCSSRLTECIPQYSPRKDTSTHVKNSNRHKEINTIAGRLESECKILNDSVTVTASTSSTSGKNQVLNRPNSYFKSGSTSDRYKSKPQYDKHSHVNSHRPVSGQMSHSMGSLDSYSPRRDHVTNGHNNHSPHHGARNSQMSRSVNGEFGSDGNDLLMRRFGTESEKVKTKLQSAWNNMKYGWTLKTKTSFKNDSAIILLGKWYHVRPPEEESSNPHHPRVPSLEEFKQDFSTRLWFTYRREFTPLPGTNYTTDCGWGCMIRSCQCLIAQALIQHFLGRDWRIYDNQQRDQEVFHREIIRWFSDIATDNSPFSIYKLVEIGKKNGKEPGDWYGPASVAHIFRDALTKACRTIPLLSELCIYVAQDCTIYKQDILDLCTARRRSSSRLDQSVRESSIDEWNRSVIILVPVRLGGESLNEIYIPCVKQILSQENCIGIIGGKPKHSLYFLGWQEDKLIYLDPHYCQDVVDTSEQNFPIQSFHCMSPRKLPFNKMDPSCTIGFYCQNETDFDNFIAQVQQMLIPKKQQGMYPLFVFENGRGSDISGEDLPEEQGFLRVRHYHVGEDGRVRSPTIESEDFVILN